MKELRCGTNTKPCTSYTGALLVNNNPSPASSEIEKLVLTLPEKENKNKKKNITPVGANNTTEKTAK